MQYRQAANDVSGFSTPAFRPSGCADWSDPHNLFWFECFFTLTTYPAACFAHGHNLVDGALPVYTYRVYRVFASVTVTGSILKKACAHLIGTSKTSEFRARCYKGQKGVEIIHRKPG